MTNVWCDVNGRFVVFSHGNQNSTWDTTNGLFQLLSAPPPPPVEEPWDFQGRGVLTLEFPGEGCIKLGISRGEVH